MFFYRLLTNITALWFPQQRDVKGNNRPPLIEVFFEKFAYLHLKKTIKLFTNMFSRYLKFYITLGSLD